MLEHTNRPDCPACAAANARWANPDKVAAELDRVIAELRPVVAKHGNSADIAKLNRLIAARATLTRHPHAMRATDGKLAQFDKAIAEQRQWIAERGGDLAGYIARYGEPGDGYGDGGKAIYQADITRLNNLLTERARLAPVTREEVMGGSHDGTGAGDHDQPYAFGRHPTVDAPFPFTTAEFARLLDYRSKVEDVYGTERHALAHRKGTAW